MVLTKATPTLFTCTTNTYRTCYLTFILPRRLLRQEISHMDPTTTIPPILDQADPNHWLWYHLLVKWWLLDLCVRSLMSKVFVVRWRPGSVFSKCQQYKWREQVWFLLLTPLNTRKDFSWGGSIPCWVLWRTHSLIALRFWVKMWHSTCYCGFTFFFINGIFSSRVGSEKLSLSTFLFMHNNIIGNLRIIFRGF